MIEFDSTSHTYTNTETGEKYISTTTLLGEYHPKFDAPLMAKRVANRDGVSVEYVLNVWEEIKNRACVKGSMIHNFMEDYIKQGKKPDGKIGWMFTEYDRIIREQISHFTRTHSEMILWNHEYKVAGMADVVIEAGKYFYIVDFKTNKAFGYESKFNEYFFTPIDHLSVCEFNSYALQLSTYAYMYELLHKKKLKKLFVLYLRPDLRSFEVIPMNYLRAEVQQIFENYKLNCKVLHNINN